MKKTVKLEIENLIKELNLNCTAKEFKDKVDWHYISSNKKLSESFIRKFKDYVNWGRISINQKLSENFIREFKDDVNLNLIGEYKKLSESFIKKFKYTVDWVRISKYQKLSESFIREFKDKVDWFHISACQKLSESFIREFKDFVDWDLISKYQKLSESFIREFKDKVNWDYIYKYQKLSPEFIKEFELTISEKTWLYKTKEFKINYIKENNLPYELVNDEYIIAYKSTRIDGYSVYNFQYKYEVGGTYESHCDCNTDEQNSFGLSAWTKDGALDYYSAGELYKVKINIEDIGCFVHENHKIRCHKFTVIEKV